MEKAIIIGEKPASIKNLKQGYQEYKNKYSFKIIDFIPFYLNTNKVWQLPAYDFAKYNMEKSSFANEYADLDSYYKACSCLVEDLINNMPDFIIVGNNNSAIGTFEGLVLLDSIGWPLNKTKRLCLRSEAPEDIYQGLISLKPIKEFVEGTCVKMTDYDRRYRIDNEFKRAKHAC